MSAQQQKIRRIVWTGAIASITMTGVWYGASLKTEVDTKEVRVCSRMTSVVLPCRWQLTKSQMVKKRREASTSDKLAELDKQRSALLAKKYGLEKKLKDLDTKMAEKARKQAEVGT